MENIGYSRIHSWWNGRVTIDELAEFKDARGMLCELWRSDDDTHPDATMSYWSETEPYVMRGPHEHVGQTDGFITWRSRMLYMLYDQQTNETKSFITDPTKITRVIVDPTVVHCYRNLEPSKILTGNFPTSLFMGKDKKEKIDEIRHEKNLTGRKMFVILGAGGRLGKAITQKFRDNIKYFDYEVLPIFHRINDSKEIVKFLDNIESVKRLTSATEICIINCSGVTNVQNATIKDRNLNWANTDMPCLLAEYTGRRGIQLIHFSTDYVYQEVKPNHTAELSSYTISKKNFEELLQESLDSGSSKTKHIRVLRVANLFSSDTSDENNLIQKIFKNVSKFNEVKHDPNIKVGLTHVDVIADWVYDNKDIISSRNIYTNLVSPDIYTIRELLDKYFDQYAKQVETPIPYIPWFDKFRYSSDSIELGSSDLYIKNLLNVLKTK